MYTDLFTLSCQDPQLSRNDTGLFTYGSIRRQSCHAAAHPRDDRQAVLRQGIRAVGVDTIAAEVGISKRTLYNYFPSKDDLIVAYLTRRLQPTEASDLPPVEQILGAFDRLERSFASATFRGCPFVNAVAELKEPAHAANSIALAFKEQRRGWFRDLLKQLDVDRPDALAMQLQILVDGAISAILVRGDPKVARIAGEAARTLLAAAGVAIPSRAAPPRRSAGRKRLE